MLRLLTQRLVPRAMPGRAVAWQRWALAVVVSAAWSAVAVAWTRSYRISDSIGWADRDAGAIELSCGTGSVRLGWTVKVGPKTAGRPVHQTGFYGAISHPAAFR